MAEGHATGEQEAPRLTKNLKWSGFIITLICIIVGVGLFVVFIFSVQDEQQRSPIPPMVLLVLAILFNFLWIAAKILRIKRKNSSTHIAPEDLENYPAPSLPYNHVPFVESSPIDLPDYFTAVQNTDEGSTSENANVCTEGVPEIRPPSYEQALEMAILSNTSEAEYA